MQLLLGELDMHRGVLALLDESTGRLRIEAAAGLSDDAVTRGQWAVGEGITGNVVATGRARGIEDIRNEPDFLNRTGARDMAALSGPLSFLCVPIRTEGRTSARSR